MFNPLGMAVGFLVANSRRSRDPMMPALVGGMLPMPLGPLAAVMIADRAPQATRPAVPPRLNAEAAGRLIDAAAARLEKLQGKGAPDALRFVASLAPRLAALPDASRAEARKRLDVLANRALALMTPAPPPEAAAKK